jgi:diguanylate cyclase (GGDEF)-like protein
MFQQIKYLYAVYLICWSIDVFPQTFSDIEQRIEQIKTPAEKLAFLQKRQTEIANFNAYEQAKFWLQLGLVQDKNNLLDEAILSFSKSIDLFENNQLPISKEWPNSYIERSYMYYLKTYDPQIYCPDRQKALTLARELNEGDTLVRALINRAFCFTQSPQQLSTGMALLEEAIKIAEYNDLPKNLYAMIYNASGNLYLKNKIYDKAYEFILKAYQQWQSVDDYKDMFNMQHSMVTLAIEQHDYVLAQQHVKTMFLLSQQQPQYQDFPFFSHYNAGLLAYSEKHYNKASIEFEQCLQLAQTTQETFFIQETKRYLAISYFRTDRLVASQALIEQIKSEGPDKIASSPTLAAIDAFFDKKYNQAAIHMFEGIDQEIDNRRQNVQLSKQAHTQIYNQSLLELDNKILHKNIEIQQLQLAEEKNQNKIAYMTLVIIVLLLISLLITVKHLVKTRRVFRVNAQTDFLTGVANRRYIYESGQKSLAKGTKMSLLLFDIDHFKKVNDQLGHDSGDRALKIVSQNASDCLRPQDEIGRIGGEEFLVLLPATNLLDASHIAEQVRANIADQQICKGEIQLSLSISIGVAEHITDENLEDVIARADKALYEAKQSGRNKVCTSLK